MSNPAPYVGLPTFAAFQSVKVANVESAHHGRAGHAVRAEHGPDGREYVRVSLDAIGDKPTETATFAVSELAAL